MEGGVPGGCVAAVLPAAGQRYAAAPVPRRCLLDAAPAACNSCTCRHHAGSLPNKGRQRCRTLVSHSVVTLLFLNFECKAFLRPAVQPPLPLVTSVRPSVRPRQGVGSGAGSGRARRRRPDLAHRTSATVACGLRANSRAAAPATTGVAIEVPERDSYDELLVLQGHGRRAGTDGGGWCMHEPAESGQRSGPAAAARGGAVGTLRLRQRRVPAASQVGAEHVHPRGCKVHQRPARGEGGAASVRCRARGQAAGSGLHRGHTQQGTHPVMGRGMGSVGAGRVLPLTFRSWRSRPGRRRCRWPPRTGRWAAGSLPGRSAAPRQAHPGSAQAPLHVACRWGVLGSVRRRGLEICWSAMVVVVGKWVCRPKGGWAVFSGGGPGCRTLKAADTTKSGCVVGSGRPTAQECMRGQTAAVPQLLEFVLVARRHPPGAPHHCRLPPQTARRFRSARVWPRTPAGSSRAGCPRSRCSRSWTQRGRPPAGAPAAALVSTGDCSPAQPTPFQAASLPPACTDRAARSS